MCVSSHNVIASINYDTFYCYLCDFLMNDIIATVYVTDNT